MTEPVTRKTPRAPRRLLMAGLLTVLGGCALWPWGPPAGDEPVETAAEHGTGEVTPADAEPAPSDGEPRLPAPTQPPETAAATETGTGLRPDAGIATGSEARDRQLASLQASPHALASGNVGYFIDVHAARLLQVLTDTPVRVQRASGRLLLTVPGELSFDVDSAEIQQAAKPVLTDIASVLAEFDRTLVSVHGHTDDRGEAEYNRALSERRATAVALFLARNGVARERLVSIGYGEEQPVVPYDSDESHTANRRIEILIEPIVMNHMTVTTAP